MRIGWNHLSTIQDTYRMIHRKAVGIGDSMVVEGPNVHDEIGDGEPLTVLLGVEEPRAGLNVDVDYQIEDQLEQPQWELHVLRCIQEANDLGEAQHPEELQDRHQAQLLKDVSLRYLLWEQLKGYRRE